MSGHYRAYAPVTLRGDALDRIGVINAIIEDFESRGYVLSLRQLYYQLVSRNAIRNREEEYSKLSRLVSAGRIQGLISWTAIVDRGRSLKGLRTFPSPEDAIKSVADTFRMDLWKDQEWRPEVWVEKEALVDVIGTVCNRHRVDFFACKGYTSQSAAWEAGQRLARYIQKGQRPIIFHLGDHDPSGLDMTRDNQERLSQFAGIPIMVQRLALNLDQIDHFEPPPNPAKMSDSRSSGYVEYMALNHRPPVSWELDALATDVIDGLIHDALEQIKDPEVWEQSLLKEVEGRQYLEELSQ